MNNRTCKRCGNSFNAKTGGRGSWIRFCSEECKAQKAPTPITKTCDAERCENLARSNKAEHCETHYYRLRRTGSLAVNKPQRASRGQCKASGCDKPDAGPNEYCSMHQTRIDRHGNPDTVLAPEPLSGSDNPSWVGDSIKVKGAHMRVRAERGPASGHACVDCHGRADHWSYDHLDPNEKQSDHGPYSALTEHYQARCVPCHKVFDLAHLASRRKPESGPQG